MKDAETWAECECPQWMLWLLLREKPDEKPAVVLLMVEQIKARTLAHVPPEHRDVCESALNAAEACAHEPTDENRCAAANANEATRAAALAALRANVKPYIGAVDAALAAAWAAEAAWCAVRAIESASVVWTLETARAIAKAATYAVEAAGFAATPRTATAARAAEESLWCAAMRARWPELQPPSYKEG